MPLPLAFRIIGLHPMNAIPSDKVKEILSHSALEKAVNS
jgi:hypothetical protein